MYLYQHMKKQLFVDSHVDHNKTLFFFTLLEHGHAFHDSLFSFRIILEYLLSFCTEALLLSES